MTDRGIAPPEALAKRPERRRRHAAAVARVIAVGASASSVLGVTAALSLNAPPPRKLVLSAASAPTAPVVTAPPSRKRRVLRIVVRRHLPPAGVASVGSPTRPIPQTVARAVPRRGTRPLLLRLRLPHLRCGFAAQRRSRPARPALVRDGRLRDALSRHGKPRPSRIAVGGPDGVVLRARQLIERLESLWSRFRPDSELSRLNEASGMPFVVSPETFEIIEHAIDAWARTGGRFDPTVLAAVASAGY